MSAALSIRIGSRPTVEVEVGSRKFELNAGSDYEGGLTATATLSRFHSQFGWLTSKGLHAANGTHSHWGWSGTRKEWHVGTWRIALWWPKRSRLMASPTPPCQ